MKAPVEDDEPVFNSAKERDAYYAKQKAEGRVQKRQPLVVKKTEEKPKAVRLKNDTGKKLELHYKNDYSKKPKRLGQLGGEKGVMMARVVLRKRY